MVVQVDFYITNSWCSLIICCLGGRGVPPGVWSRSGCADMGFKNGSMLSYLEKSQEAGKMILITQGLRWS